MNFTSDVYTGFKPYTPQNPIDAEVMVGQQQQAKLEAGIQKVQGYVDTLHGFDIAKGVTRDYISGKIGSMRETINNVAGDFSDQRLVNQVGGMAGKIASDPIVENGILSTAAYRKGLQDINDSKKVGKDGVNEGYAPQNEWDFMTKAYDWLNDNDFTSQFGATYTPHTDYMKRFTAAYKEIHPDSSLTQDQVRIKDGSGEIEVLNERTREGIDANEVSRLWNTIYSDPEVQQQVAIDARYHYRNMGPEDMYNHLTEDYQKNIGNINGKIREIQERAAVDRTVKPSQVSSAIKALRDQGSEYAEKYKNLVGLIPGVGNNHSIQNLDVAKEAMFSLDLQSNLASTYSWSKNTDKIVDSPLWKAHREQINFELDLAKYGEDVRHNKATEQISLLNALKPSGKGSAKEKGEGETANGTSFISTEGQVDQASANNIGSASYYSSIKDKEAKLDQQIKASLFNIANSKGLDNPFVRTGNDTIEYNPAYPGGPQAAVQAGRRLWNTQRQAIIDGKATDAVIDQFNRVDPLIRELNSDREKAKSIEARHQPSLDKALSEYGKPIDRKMLDFWIVENNAPGKEAAQKRIDALSNKERQEFEATIYDAIPTEYGVSSVHTKNYLDFSSFLKKNSSIVPNLQKKEEDFKNLQTVYNPITTLLETPDNKSKEAWRQRYLNLATNKYNVNDNAKDFLKELAAGTPKEKALSEANVYSTVFDKNANKWQLVVSRAGKDNVTLDVSEKDIQDLGIQTGDAFWDKFGADLSLTQNTKTDLYNRGEASAYILSQPKGSKYQVKYHIYGDGSGQYGMRVFIRDQNGKDYGEGNLGGFFNKDAIMSVVQNGLRDQEVEGILSKNR